jgi:hypothetical protein
MSFFYLQLGEAKRNRDLRRLGAARAGEAAAAAFGCATRRDRCVISAHDRWLLAAPSAGRVAKASANLPSHHDA